MGDRFAELDPVWRSFARLYGRNYAVVNSARVLTRGHTVGPDIGRPKVMMSQNVPAAMPMNIPTTGRFAATWMKAALRRGPFGAQSGQERDLE